MEFQRLRIGAFGVLRDLDTGPDPLPRLVVVLGPNEAGKSTLFGFLTSMLYGIYPASRDRNPYTPWNGGDIEGRAVLRLEGGEVQEIHRRLLSSPSGTLTRGTAGEDVRNRTLPCAEHVPREVFRQVFALTLAELARLEGESWDRVQDRLVTGMGASDLASVRSAVEDLEREAGRLWRTNRMGNQRVRDLRERIRELRTRHRAAADADRRLREAARERDIVAEELREARKERESCHLYVERCQTVLPLRERLRRIDELEELAGPAEELEGLPPDPEVRLGELEAQVRRTEARLAALDGAAAEREACVDAYGKAARAIVARAGDIRDGAARAAGLQPLRVRAGQLEQELRDLGRRCDDEARELLEVLWTEVDEASLLGVPASRLRRAVEEYREAREALRLAEEAVRSRTAGTSALPSLPRWVGPALVALATAGLAAAAAAGRGAALAVAAGLLGVGVALTAVERLVRGTSADDRAPPARERVVRAASAEAGARARVADLLHGLPVRPELVEQPPADLGASFRRLQELLGDRRDRDRQLDEVRRQLDAAEEEIRVLAADLGVDVPADPVVAAHRLEASLRDAEALREAASAARVDLDGMGRERAALRAELDGAREAHDGLRARLADLARPHEDGLWAGQAVRERLEARDRARRLREELEREHPDLEGLRRRIRREEEAGAGWSLDADTLAARKAREAELADEVEDLARRLEGLEKDMDYLRLEEPVGAVDSEIEAVRAELEASLRARDRLWVLAAVLREADRRFRDEHQPDILRRAGCHLATITGGRYERILLDEAAEGRFLLDGPGYPGPLEVDEPISTGTREQVYLALRLAILDHLDRSGERLPLFMDEAFVNWDEVRRERGFGLLEDITRTRQVFVFTCHEAMARSLTRRGGRLLTLDAVP